MELCNQNMICLIFQFYVTLLVTPTDGTLLEPLTRLIICPDSVKVIYLIWNKKVKRYQQNNNIIRYLLLNCIFAFKFFLNWFFLSRMYYFQQCHKTKMMTMKSLRNKVRIKNMYFFKILLFACKLLC